MAKPHLTLASICISWALFGLSPSNAQTLTDEAGRACSQAVTTPDDAITSCSAVIDSGTVSGRQLAAAYAQRGYARTLKRSLTEAEADLDAAIKIDPDYAEAYANRANFWTVINPIAPWPMENRRFVSIPLSRSPILSAPVRRSISASTIAPLPTTLKP